VRRQFYFALLFALAGGASGQSNPAPLAAIANTQKIAAVIVAGKLFPKAALQEMLEKTEAAVKPK
jgi:hypothetical protein